MRVGRARRSASSRGDFVVQSLLTELACALLRRGLTPKRFTELARLAFVQAAAQGSKLRNGRVNQSRVAAQTGLSRAEVSRLLRRDSVPMRQSSRPAPVERVVNGWRTDRVFTDKQGQPRRLRISGATRTFAGLVKKYAGDVPHRALLEELRRLRAIRDDGVCVQLNASRDLRTRHDFSFLSPVLPVLVDCLRIVTGAASSRPSSSIFRLTIPIDDEASLGIVRERSVSSAMSMLDELDNPVGASGAAVTRPEKAACSLTVTILVAEGEQETRGTT